MLFFRVFQHLLPDSIAWRILKRSQPWVIGDGHSIGDAGLRVGGTTGGRTIERWFEGLARLPESVRTFIDLAYLDLFPSSTRQLDIWENQFGLETASIDADRRARLAGEWKATGGQSPRYIQDVLHAAGFNIYVHEWWDPDTDALRDPHNYTVPPTMGTVQCAGPGQWQCAAGGSGQGQCNAFLANEPHYLVNDLLDRQAPPPVPADPARWPRFVYFGAEVFPVHAQVFASRRKELERLVLKLRPTQLWVVMLVDYVEAAGPFGQLDFSNQDQSAWLGVARM